MPKIQNDPFFDLTTLLGYRYRITFGQILTWFMSWKYCIFFIIANISLILFAPHNGTYDFVGLESAIFWPIITFEYTILCIVMFWVGRAYALSKDGRIYYTPITVIICAIIGTYSGAFLIGYIKGIDPDLSVFKAMEVFFNFLFVCLFEASFFYFVADTTAPKKGSQHNWEKF